MEVHHTVQFDVTDTALEHAMLGSQLFATDVIAYAFQVYKPVNQNERERRTARRVAIDARGAFFIPP